MRILFAALALMASACSPMTAPAPDTATPSQTAEQACAASGGELMRVGRLQTQQCVVPYADGGKVCRDGDDCEGNCYSETTGPQSGPITGRCAVNALPFGCRTPVENGQVGATLCVD